MKMKKSIVLSILVFGLVGALATSPAFSSDILYNNTTGTSYSVSATDTAWEVNNGYTVTDSFVLSQSSVVTGATFPFWLSFGDSATSVNWEITSSPYGAALYSGTATGLPNDFLNLSFNGAWDVDEESISLPNLSLAAGDYWFQLSDVTTADSGPAFWDQSLGASSAYENGPGYDDYAIGSQTFEILGDGGPAVPEPSSFLLLGSGLAGLAGLLKRKLRA
jgi:hypothetical protein